MFVKAGILTSFELPLASFVIPIPAEMSICPEPLSEITPPFKT
jgi:hypothetical protein